MCPVGTEWKPLLLDWEKCQHFSSSCLPTDLTHAVWKPASISVNFKVRILFDKITLVHNQYCVTAFSHIVKKFGSLFCHPFADSLLFLVLFCLQFCFLFIILLIYMISALSPPVLNFNFPWNGMMESLFDLRFTCQFYLGAVRFLSYTKIKICVVNGVFFLKE